MQGENTFAMKDADSASFSCWQRKQEAGNMQ